MCVCVEEVTSGMKGKFGSVRKLKKKKCRKRKEKFGRKWGKTQRRK